MPFTCGECGKVEVFQREYDSDMPEGWFALEDRAIVSVVCSIQCLVVLVRTLERRASLPQEEP
jgi:hypothetical protein